MKKIGVFLILVSIIGCAGAPDIEPVTGEVGVLIVDVPDAKQDDLYIIANSWVVDKFVSAESVIEFQDKESGTIKGKYASKTTDGLYNVDVITVLTIQVKDEKGEWFYEEMHR